MRTMTDYTPIAREMPPKDTPIEWIAPCGRIVRGRYAGGAIWFPEGSPMYVYYTPTYWRRATIADMLEGE
jgi:hypothetical protein